MPTVDQAFNGGIAHGLKPIFCLTDDVLLRSSDASNILNDGVFWLENLNHSSHSKIEEVSFVCASGVIVEVGIALTGRTTNDEVDLTDRFHEFTLRFGRRLPTLAVNHRLDGLRSNFNPGEIFCIDLRCCRENVPCNDGLQVDVQIQACCLYAQADAATSRKEVNHSDCSLR